MRSATTSGEPRPWFEDDAPDNADIFREIIDILRTKWLVRAPIALFRAGMGFLFGGRMLLLEHIGRTSGEARYVVLEVLTRPSRGEVVIASGFGRKSQWLQNIQANPDCHVSIGAAQGRGEGDSASRRRGLGSAGRVS